MTEQTDAPEPHEGTERAAPPLAIDADANVVQSAVEQTETVSQAASMAIELDEPEEEEEGDNTNWYVVHTYSGYERKVKESLEERVRALELGEEICEILIPTEDVVEMKGGKKVVTSKKFFPGYLLVRMVMNDELWHLVKSTPRVTGFVGEGRNAIALTQPEVDKILNRMEESVEAPKPKFQFNKGESVRITDGPFTNFSGMVEEVDMRRNTLKVMVSIFGRATPVELDFFQVEKG